jgi:hypothetical protein
MTDAELDQTYTALCEALSAAGPTQGLQMLSRFALLSIVEIDDPARIAQLIARAGADPEHPRGLTS